MRKNSGTTINVRRPISISTDITKSKGKRQIVLCLQKLTHEIGMEALKRLTILMAK